MNVRAFFRKYGTLVGLLFAVVYFSLATPHFLELGNWMNILRQVAVTSIIACGMTLVVIQRSFDLSVGSIAGTSAVIVAFLIGRVGATGAVMAALGFALLFGLFNALSIIYLRLSGIVTTLATLFIGNGLEFLLSDGGKMIQISSKQVAFAQIGRGFVGFVPVPVIIVLGMAFLFHIFLMHTRPGRYMYAIGDNPMATIMSGIEIRFYVALSFVVSGFMAGLGGVMWAARISAAIPGTSQVFLLDSIAAVFIGATIAKEGQSHIVGSLLGAIFMGIVTNGTSMLGFTVASQNIFKGAVLMLAVVLTAFMQQKELRTVFT